MRIDVVFYGLLFIGAAIASIAGAVSGGAAALVAVILYIIVILATSIGFAAYIATHSPDVNGEKERDARVSPANRKPVQKCHEHKNQTHRSVHP